MQAGGPVHDPLVSFSTRDPGAEADGPGAGGCEGVSVCSAVCGGMLKKSSIGIRDPPHLAGISCLNGGSYMRFLGNCL